MSAMDRKEWQAEQAARDAALEAQREREAKARERSARNAQRKLARLQRTLKESGEITAFEDEFADSVAERLDRFGAAFADPQLGRPGDALSAAQKRVVASMNRKVKDARRAAKAQASGEAGEKTPTPRRKSSFRSRGSGFKSKSGYTPRVRQLDEEFEADESVSAKAMDAVARPTEEAEPAERPPVGKPFLRIVK